MSSRRSQIIDTAERRFLEVGYLGCSIADIIDELGIAKGTFYHHFPSKEAVMEAVIDRHIMHLKAGLIPIASDSTIPAIERLSIILTGHSAGQQAGHTNSNQAAAPRPENSRELATELETPGNEHFHATAQTATTRELTPVLAQIFADGIEEGSFHMADPVATAAAFLVVTGQLVDGDAMGWRRTQNFERLGGLMAAAEQLLGVETGALAHLLQPASTGHNPADHTPANTGHNPADHTSARTQRTRDAHP